MVKIERFKYLDFSHFFMKRILEPGKVYVLGIVNKNIPRYEELQIQIGEIAEDFFSKRYAIDSSTDKPFIPYGSDHNSVIERVNGLITPHIPKNAKKILDVGGSDGSRIANIGSDLEKHVVDIAVPEKRESGVYFTNADINKGLFYNDRSFDCTILLWTIAHVLEENRRGLIEEIHRILKPGGYLYLKEVKAPEIDEMKKDFEDRLEPFGYKFGDYFYAVFEALTQKGIKKVEEEAIESGRILHDIELDTANFKKVSDAMYGSALTFERLESYYKDLFNLDSITLIGFRENSGKVIKEIKPESEGVWLAVLKKK